MSEGKKTTRPDRSVLAEQRQRDAETFGDLRLNRGPRGRVRFYRLVPHTSIVRAHLSCRGTAVGAADLARMQTKLLAGMQIERQVSAARRTHTTSLTAAFQGQGKNRGGGGARPQQQNPQQPASKVHSNTPILRYLLTNFQPAAPATNKTQASAE